MTIEDKYTFNIDFPNVGSREVFPINGSLQWQYKKENEKRYFRKELITKLIFQNDSKESITDFDPWYLLERNKDRCAEVKLNITGECDDYKAKATVLDADFDAEICRVDVKFAPDDPYSCIHNNWERERNILPPLVPQTAQVFSGEIEISQKCFTRINGSAFDSIDRANFPYSLVTECADGSTIDLDDGWSPFTTFFYHESNGDPNNPDAGVWFLEMTYIREKSASATEPSGFGWISVDGGYARIAPTKIVNEQIGYGIVRIDRELALPDGLGIDNGRLLNDVILYLFNEHCSLPVVSNFFGINPDATNPDNTAYDKALLVLQELMVFHKGDIIRHNADDNVSLLNMTLKKLLEMLKIIFNVEYRIRDDKIYLEHYSYFQADLKLDLTQEQWLDCIKDAYKWTYKKEVIPSQELFEWEERSDEGTNSYEFDARPILYTEDCFVDSNEKRNFRADVVMTNILALIDSGDIDEWNITANSFVLVATSGGEIIREAGALSGEPKLNGSLAWANLITSFHYWGRPMKRGFVHGLPTEFTSPQKIRKQAPITIQMCCEDLANFDPERMIVQTQLGFGEVENAVYDEPAGTLTLDLVFE